MLLTDVNVLVYAHRVESDRHAQYRDWLGSALRGAEPFGVNEALLASFLRIVTHRRVYEEPTPMTTAVSFCEAVLASPATVLVHPGGDHWRLFAECLTSTSARGNDVPDAYLAALALEHGATWITTDRGFAQYPGLRWRHPLQPE